MLGVLSDRNLFLRQMRRLILPNVDCCVVSSSRFLKSRGDATPHKGRDGPQERVQVSNSWFHFSLSTSGLRDVRISGKLWVT
jgi:hypothetical protein